MTTESRIKMSDILVGAFLLGLFAIALTVVVFYAMIALFPDDLGGAMLGALSLIISLELIELIFMMYILYRRQGPSEGGE